MSGARDHVRSLPPAGRRLMIRARRSARSWPASQHYRGQDTRDGGCADAPPCRRAPVRCYHTVALNLLQVR